MKVTPIETIVALSSDNNVGGFIRRKPKRAKIISDIM